MAGEPTFEPPCTPDFGFDDSRSPRLKRTEFGDGYVQRRRDGLNHDPLSVELVWTNVSHEEGDAIFDFLEARGGDEAFFYDLPFVGLIKWTAPAYRRSYTDPDTMRVSAAFEECFDP